MFESLMRLIGALYIEHGIHVVRDFIVKHVLRRSIDIAFLLESFNPKSDLLRLVNSGSISGIPAPAQNEQPYVIEYL